LHTNGIEYRGTTNNKLRPTKISQGEDAVHASPKTYTKNRKGRPAMVITQSCEICCVAPFAVVAVEGGGEVDDGDGPLVLGVEDETGGVEDDIEDGMAPTSEVDI
jgi:hypothetical protein